MSIACQSSVVALRDGLLPPVELVELWQHTVNLASDFVPSRVIGHGEDAQPVVDSTTRRNLHLQGTANVPTRVMDLLRREVPRLASNLGGEPVVDWSSATYEAEITATRSGGFFAAHVDNGNRRIQDRSLTFVLFFSAVPRPFDGGELLIETNWRDENRLLIFDAVRDGPLGRPDVAATVEPVPGRLVLFRSNRLHEVSPVTTRSSSFADSRFTITGFVRT